MAENTDQYTSALKRQMVAVARSRRTLASLSREYGASAMTIGGWVTQDARNAGTGDCGLSSAEREKLRRLYGARTGNCKRIAEG